MFPYAVPGMRQLRHRAIAGRELQIDSIEVDIPDDDEENED